MEVKKGYEFLNGIRNADNKIRRLENELAELRSCELPRSGQDGPPVQHTRTGSDVERIAERIIELEQQIEDAKVQKKIIVIKVCATIEKLPEGLEKTILSDFYIAKKSMKRISINMRCSLGHCYKMRKSAIEMLEVPEDSEE